jgi:hypothetical protein
MLAQHTTYLPPPPFGPCLLNIVTSALSSVSSTLRILNVSRVDILIKCFFLPTHTTVPYCPHSTYCFSFVPIQLIIGRHLFASRSYDGPNSVSKRESSFALLRHFTCWLDLVPTPTVHMLDEFFPALTCPSFFSSLMMETEIVLETSDTDYCTQSQ